MTSEQTFPGFDAPVVVKESYGRRLTAARKAAIAKGRHPCGAPLAENGKTGGDCWFAVHAGWERRSYWKCERANNTHSSNTDLRLSWPACTLFAAAKPEGWETQVRASMPRASAR